MKKSAAMSYSDKLKDPRWQRMRLEVMGRDGFRCRDCGRDDQSLHVHHCFYEKGDPWETGANFLLTLCDSCHESRGTLEIDARRMLAQITVKLKASGGLFGNDLKAFVSSLADFATATDYDAPVVVSAGELEHNASARWWIYAFDHPEFRPAYEGVTGLSVKWPSATSHEKAQNNPTNE